MKCLLFLALQVLAMWPVGVWYYRLTRYADPAKWEVLPLLVVVGLVLYHARRLSIPAPPVARRLVVALVLYAVASPFLPDLPRAICAFTLLAATAAAMMPGRGGGVALWGLLLLALPLLPILQYHLGFPLRVIVATLAAPLVELGGVEVTREGTCLAWSGGLVGVDAPCSGLRMLWSGLLLVTGLAAVCELESKRTVLAILLTLFGVVLANVLRTSVLFFQETELVPMPPWSHEAVGIAIHAVAVVLLYFLVQRLRRSQCAPSFRT